MKIGVSSKDVSLRDLSMIAYWKIRARLLRVRGVANVPIWGERIKMPQVQVDPKRKLNASRVRKQLDNISQPVIHGGAAPAIPQMVRNVHSHLLR